MWPAEKSARATRVLCLCAVVYVCFFAGLDSFGLVGPDEPRYASIARAMAETGDWVTPRLNGAPWFEKPPLYYWTAAIGFRVFSSPEVAARIPSSFFAFAMLLAILWIARRIYGAPVAYLAGWMLPTTVAMLGFAHAAATDMPFAACLTMAMVASAVLLFDDVPEHRWLWAAGFGAALGLAVLAKGPAAIALAAGSTALWALATGNVRRSLRLFHPLAVCVFFLVALPWYVLCAVRNPEFLRIFLLEHNVERFLTNRFQHQQALWFYAPILLVAVFPWTLLLVPAFKDAWRAVRAGAWRELPATFFAAWIAFPFIFFSAAQSKLPGYILPAVPPVILLLAHTATRRLRSNPQREWHLVFSVAIPLMTVGVATMVICYLFPSFLPTEVTSPGVSDFGGPRLLADIAFQVAAMGLVLVAGYPAKDKPLWTTSTIAVFLICTLVVVYSSLMMLDSKISARTIGFGAHFMVRSPDKVSSYHLARAWQYGLDFYIHRPVPEWAPGAPRPAWIITDEAGCAQLSAEEWVLEPIEPGSSHATLYRVKNAQE